MYLCGNNSFTFPWEIPKDMPRDSLRVEDMKKLVDFIDDYNPKLKFNLAEKMLFKLLWLIYLPAAKYLHWNMRRKKFKQLQQALYLLYPPQFW